MDTVPLPIPDIGSPPAEPPCPAPGDAIPLATAGGHTESPLTTLQRLGQEFDEADDATIAEGDHMPTPTMQGEG